MKIVIFTSFKIIVLLQTWKFQMTCSIMSYYEFSHQEIVHSFWLRLSSIFEQIMKGVMCFDRGQDQRLSCNQNFVS